MTGDASYGSGAEKRELMTCFARGVRLANADDVCGLLRDFAAKTRKEGWSGKAVNKLMRGSPMECTFPAMRTKPTSYGQRVPIGPLHAQITSNEAEVTMHTMLPVRREGDLARSQVRTLSTTYMP